MGSMRYALTGGLLVWVMAGLMATLVVAEARAESATAAMQKTLDRVLVVLGDPSLQAPERAGERLAAMERLIGERFDYKEMGKRTLGRGQWEMLDAAQRKEFVSLFRRFLSKTYAGNLDNYSGEKIEYLNERRKGNFAEVQTAVFANELEVPIHYRLLKDSETWKVYDVVIDGISLVKNFRSQFERIIRDKSLKGLFETLRGKLAPEVSRVDSLTSRREFATLARLHKVYQ